MDLPKKEKSIRKEDGTEKTLCCYTANNGYFSVITTRTPKPEDEREHEYDMEETVEAYVSKEDPLKDAEEDSQGGSDDSKSAVEAIREMDMRLL